MKKLTIVILLFLLALANDHTYAQLTKAEKQKESKIEKVNLKKVDGDKVNEASKINFQTDFGILPEVTWIRTEDYDEAVFTKDGQQLNAYYDNDGRLVGTLSLKTFADLPIVGQNNLKVLFWNYSIQQIIYFNYNNLNKTPMKLWGLELDNTNNYLVEMVYGFRRLIVYVDPKGKISLFKQL